ncbi:hypothetical protein RRG08_035869 [Elysia crispata]|uniref:Reverse transcriptase domain-containing protein n=1 Tax=Elysia crispata TaxID=231223 RepID=A0AAE1B0N5_9GAST|nr:hypothetical protein RRG08_035869 [Elysia crispata]
MTWTLLLGSETSEPFDISDGMKQGCVLAPVIFNLFFTCVLNRQGHRRWSVPQAWQDRSTVPAIPTLNRPPALHHYRRDEAVDNGPMSLSTSAVSSITTAPSTKRSTWGSARQIRPWEDYEHASWSITTCSSPQNLRSVTPSSSPAFFRDVRRGTSRTSMCWKVSTQAASGSSSASGGKKP